MSDCRRPLISSSSAEVELSAVVGLPSWGFPMIARANAKTTLFYFGIFIDFLYLRSQCSRICSNKESGPRVDDDDVDVVDMASFCRAVDMNSRGVVMTLSDRDVN